VTAATLGRRTPPLEADVAVVGGGLPALAAALELARRQVRVAVIGSDPGGPAARGLGLALLGPGRPYARLAAALGRTEARLVWAAGCENHLRLRDFLQSAGRDCGYAPRGSFLLALDRAEAAELAESEDMLRDDGFPGEFLDHYMLETRFDLAGFPGAYWAAEDAEIEGQQLLEAIDARARAAGVAFVAGAVRAFVAEASSVSVETEEAAARAGAAIVATDGAAAGLVPELRPLLRPAAPGRLRASTLRGASLPSAARSADGRFAWRCREGAIVVSGTGPAEEGPGDRLLAFAQRIPVEVPSALRWEETAEVTADGLPLVGRLPGRPVAVACGFGALPAGFAFAASRWVADALVGGTDPTPEALRATREPAAV
jgi:glycine/D-amino acid oxidase-like deaminating enzyme